MEKLLWTDEELLNLSHHFDFHRVCGFNNVPEMPIGITAEKLESIKKMMQLKTQKEGIKHSALIVCSSNYARSPLAQGILCKMLSDIGKREEWALGGAAVEGSNDGIYPSTKFILDREGCRVYKGQNITKELFHNYEFIIDFEHRTYFYWIQDKAGISKQDYLNKVRLLGTYIPAEDYGEAKDLKKGEILDYISVSPEVLFDKIYEGCRNFLLKIYPGEAEKITKRVIKNDSYRVPEHTEFFSKKYKKDQKN